MSKKKKSTEDIAQQAIAKAGAMKEVSEQNVRKQLMESFAPQLKKMISQSILEMEDDEEEMEDEDGMYEEDGDDIDPEDLEDLESALEEGEEGDDEDGDGHVEVPTDEVPDEEMEVPDEMEEGSDEYEDMDEESDEDFMAELRAIIEAEDDDDFEDMEDMDEGSEEDLEDMDEGSEEDLDALQEVEGKKNGDSFNQDAPPEGHHTKKYESNDGGSHTETSKGEKYHTKKYEEVLAENQRLKEALSEINSTLNESVLDEYKTNRFTSFVNQRSLTETAKLKVMRAIDEGKNEREVDRIVSVFESTLPNSSKKRSRISESKVKGGRNSSIKKPRSKKKSINESAGSNNGFEWANRLAHLADVK